MTEIFVSGPLGHAPLRAVVLGGAARSEPALLQSGGREIGGVVLSELSSEQLGRLGFYSTASGFDLAEREIMLQSGAKRSMVAYISAESGWAADSQAEWLRCWAETATATAVEVMAMFGFQRPELLRHRWGQVLARGGAAARAAHVRPGTETLRRSSTSQDVISEARRWPYASYFAVEEHDLRFRRFDGTMSAVLDRAVFISGDAAVVLPYDPVRDRVMVIEQFRVGPYARGDANPWLIETVAGRIDAGETPEEAARREANEEAGLILQALIAGPRYYPSPAAKAEYIYSFVGIADLPDSAAGHGGLASEAKDIRSHVMSFDRLMELVDSGEIDNAPLQLIALWLARERPALRARV